MARIRLFSENATYDNCCAPLLYQKKLLKNTFLESFPLKLKRSNGESHAKIWSEESTRSVIRLKFLDNDFACIKVFTLKTTTEFSQKYSRKRLKL